MANNYSVVNNKRLQEPDEALADLLRAYSRVIWLLDIRFDPESDTEWPQYRGEWLKQEREKQYRHAKGLGMVGDQLYHPEPAIRKILKMVQQNESFVLFSDNWDHALMVERLVRQRAQEQNIPLEDPYRLQPGDVCLAQLDGGARVDVILHHRHTDVYAFVIDPRNPEWHGSIHPVDLDDLQVIDAGAYLCAECNRGAATVKWREQPAKKMCRHCFWLWDLKYGDA